MDRPTQKRARLTDCSTLPANPARRSSHLILRPGCSFPRRSPQLQELIGPDGSLTKENHPALILLWLPPGAHESGQGSVSWAHARQNSRGAGGSAADQGQEFWGRLQRAEPLLFRQAKIDAAILV